MKNIDSNGHVKGRSTFLDDLPVHEGTLCALAFGSPIAHGRITGAELEAARAIPGVVDIFSYADIPGDNQVGGIIPDEPLLAEQDLHYQGQPIFLIVAEDNWTARQARRLIQLRYTPLLPITDVEEAWGREEWLFRPRTFRLGDIDTAWSQCTYLFECDAETGGQEHLYLEPQGAYAIPREHGGIKLYSATQGPTLVQRTVARVLSLPMHQVEVEVPRLGGGFGGKEDQATAWACLAALAAWRLQRPVKIALHRQDDMRMTGKRHPYRSHFRIGLSKSMKILAYEVTYLQNGGAAADLSPAILERTLFHATNSYFIPNVKATAYSCRTNLPPNTAFRGFGAPQAMFVLEAAIAQAACELGISARRIQEANLLKEGDEFPYGQRARQAHARQCWAAVEATFDIRKKEQAIMAYNHQHSYQKKGLAMMPVCFGISFTKTPMNQASALVHIYQDGSIGLSSGAVEMGQGVNTKLVQVAAMALAVHPRRIKVETTDTTRVANTSPTAASSGADLNGKAVQQACVQLRRRLTAVAALILHVSPAVVQFRAEKVWCKGQPTALDWEKLIAEAFLRRVNLSAQGHYATPMIYFDKDKEKGHPFAYHVFGAAAISATVDCIRGTYEIDEVDIIHDFGNSLNIAVDQGQVEGGVVQGIGWMTAEEVVYSPEGRLLSDSLSTYKVPDITAAPKVIDCRPLGLDGPGLAILRSKAVGEPPLMYGIGAYFALLQAIRAFNPAYVPDFKAPFTPERVLMALYQNENAEVL